MSIPIDHRRVLDENIPADKKRILDELVIKERLKNLRLIAQKLKPVKIVHHDGQDNHTATTIQSTPTDEEIGFGPYTPESERKP